MAARRNTPADESPLAAGAHAAAPRNMVDETIPDLSTSLAAPNVAHYLQVDRATVLRLLNSNELRGYKIGGQWRVTTTDLRAYIESCQNF
jgi:excisionase family DNA binding protein